MKMTTLSKYAALGATITAELMIVPGLVLELC